ncbi:MAG: hypothetical protein DCC55_15060 [Chloroflexi bacterium]|nr:MAG: hypothetical protein DCC55_15060 [Chloroflexota bacterium]
MRTIFSRFEHFAEADEAVRALQDKGFSEDAINVLVNAKVAKANLDEVNLARVHVDVTDAVGEQELSGLALLVGNEQPVNVPGVGPVLAAGQLATLLAGSAVPSSQGSDDMQDLLEDYGIPADTAARYCSALSGTGVLVWVRTEDERIGDVAQVFRGHGGHDVRGNEDR